MKAKLETLSVSVLREFAKDKNIKNISTMRKSELIDAIIAAAEGEEKREPAEVEAVVSEDARAEHDEAGISDESHHKSEQYVKEDKKDNYHAQPRQEHDAPLADGILEVLSDGYGFIRCENFLPGENDVYVSPSQIRKFNLKTGDIIQGPKRMKASGEKFSALMYLETVNGKDPSVAQRRPAFESLTPIFPNERIHLEKNSSTVAMRMVDLISPIGKGQRGMIVSQPKSGKTTLLKQIANAVTKNNPEMHLIILLIDERPEEVTDIKESIVGDNVEVIYSTFDELPERHKRVSEMVIERAKRLVEQKTDVIILLDSITTLQFRQVDVHFQVVLTLQHFICLRDSLAQQEICVRVEVLQSLQLLLLRQEARWMTLYSRNLREQVIWNLFLTESYQKRECSLQLI